MIVTGRVAETQIEPKITALDSNLNDLRNAKVGAYSRCSKFFVAVNIQNMENQIRILGTRSRALEFKQAKKGHVSNELL